MKLPIKTYLALNGYIEEPITEENPFLSKYKLEYATKSRFRSPNGYIEIQQFEGATYQILYYEMDLLESEYFPFDLNHSNIYFRFNIEGTYKIHQVETDFYKKAKSKTYAPAYHAEGKHGIQIEAKISRIFTIVFRSDGPKLNFKSPHFSPLVDAIKGRERPKESIALMHVALIWDITVILEKIFNLKGDPEIIRAKIKENIAFICKIYNTQFENKLNFKWIEADAHLLKHCDDEYLKMEDVIWKFGGKNRSFFLRKFNEEYDCTPFERYEYHKLNKRA